MERRPGQTSHRRIRQGDYNQGSPQFVPPEERIATFDQDGTLWVEHPMYTQVMYCLEQVPALVKAKPELAKVAPFNTVLELLHGDRAAMEKLTLPDLEKIAHCHDHRHVGRDVSGRGEDNGSRKQNIRAGRSLTPS